MIEKIPTWDKHYMEMCHLLARRSKDTSTKVGAVIIGEDNEVISTGYNCFPRGINDNVESRYNRPNKYLWFEHAERNAIYNAARSGLKLKDCRLYVPFCPCSDCGRAIIQSGIKEVLVETLDIPDRWRESCEAAIMMFREANVNYHTI